MTRRNPPSKPSAYILAQRPHLAEDVDRSFRHLDSFDLLQDWQARIDAGLIKVR